MKINSWLRCFFLFLLCSISLKAVAQGAEQERRYTQQREAANRAADERAHINAAGTNNAPNSSNKYISPLSGPGRTSSTGTYNYAKIQKEMAAAAAATAAYKAQRAAEYEKLIHDNAVNVLARQDKYVNDGISFDTSSITIVEDKKLKYYDEYWSLAYKKKTLDYDRASIAYKLFCIDSAKSDYQSLLELAEEVNLYPFTSNQCYKTLIWRFPSQSKETRKAMLYASAYFFGADRPNLTYGHSSVVNFHPYCFMDQCRWSGECSSSQKGALAYFHTLATSFPTEALIVAGRCRAYLNPFLLQAKNCTDDSCKEQMYMKVLYTPRAKLNIDFVGEEIGINTYGFGTWNDPSTQQIGEAADWLIANRLEMLKALSKEDWKLIAQAQNFNIETLAYHFRERKYPSTLKPVINHLKELKSAIKETNTKK